MLQGTTKVYKQPKSDNTSGKQVTRHFCGDCGTPLWAESEAAPEGLYVKLAPFGNNLLPGAELFWRNAHSEYWGQFDFQQNSSLNCCSRRLAEAHG